MAKRPNQITLIEPFTPRVWSTVNKDCVSVFPTLDKRNGETDREALYNPLLGSQYDELDSPNPGLNVIYKDVFSPATTGDLLLERTGSTTFTIAAGRAIINNVYTESLDTITVDLSDSASYLDSTAFNDTTAAEANSTYVVLFGDIDTTQAGVSVVESGDYETWVADRTANGLTSTYVILGFISTNDTGEIESDGVHYTYDIYTRTPYTYETLIRHNPLNCGTVRYMDATSNEVIWGETWNYDDANEMPLVIIPD